MTLDEMINALESVLSALYQQQDQTRFLEVLTAAENITGALRYDFCEVLARLYEKAMPNDHDIKGEPFEF